MPFIERNETEEERRGVSPWQREGILPEFHPGWGHAAPGVRGKCGFDEKPLWKNARLN